MGRMLVTFGTTDGHTSKVARRLGAFFGVHGIDVDVVQAGATDVDPNHYDAVVVCASVHAGKYQRPVVKWACTHSEVLNSKPTAFVSVCLGVLQKDPRVDRDLDAIAEKFFAATGWQPRRVRKVAGALLYRNYGWIKRSIMKRLVAKAGGDIDTSRNYEYTDWNELQAFADDFARLVTPARTPRRTVVNG